MNKSLIKALIDTEEPEHAREVGREDPLGSSAELLSQEVPPGVDRRNFLIRSAVVGAAAIMTGKTLLASERTYVIVILQIGS